MSIALTVTGKLRFATLLVAGIVGSAVLWGGNLAAPDALLTRSYAIDRPASRIHLDESESAVQTAVPITLTKAAPVAGEPSAAPELRSAPLTVGTVARVPNGEAGWHLVDVLAVEDIDATLAGVPGARLQLATVAVRGGSRETMKMVFTIRDRAPARHATTERAL